MASLDIHHTSLSRRFAPLREIVLIRFWFSSRQDSKLAKNLRASKKRYRTEFRSTF